MTDDVDTIREALLYGRNNPLFNVPPHVREPALAALEAIRDAILRGCVCGRPAHDFQGSDIDAYHDENNCRACAAARELLTLVAVVHAAAASYEFRPCPAQAGSESARLVGGSDK